MNNDNLQDIWDRRPEEPKMSRAEIEHLMRPHLERNTTQWNFSTCTYLAFIAGTLVCEGMNLYAYRENTLILSIGVVATLLTLAFLGFGVRLLRRSTAIEESSDSLVVQLQRRLRFQRTELEVWLWMIAVTFVFLTLAVTTLVDIEDGTFRINKPVVFTGIMTVQLFFGYAAAKIGILPHLRESKAILSDLEHQVTTGTEAVWQQRKSWRKWLIVSTILLTALFIYGLKRALG